MPQVSAAARLRCLPAHAPLQGIARDRKGLHLAGASSSTNTCQPCLPAVLYPAADPCWLDFAVGLSCLRDLRLTAAQLRLQPEEGLACLLPLRGSLAALRLDGCLLLTDAGASLLAQLRCAGTSPLLQFDAVPCPPHARKAALPAVSSQCLHVLPAPPVQRPGETGGHLLPAGPGGGGRPGGGAAPAGTCRAAPA